MKKVIVYCGLVIGVISLLSCASSIATGISAEDVANGRGKCNSCSGKYTPTATSVSVKKETKKMLQSHVVKMAGAEMDAFTYYFVINENKTFSVIVNIHDTKQYDFRAGTFQSKGDTLNLNYYKNLKSDYLGDKAVIDNNKGEVYFLGAGSSKTTRLKILNEL